MTARILVGDCIEMMRTLPDGSARCCVTSPPYWGLRDYGTGRWDGGDAACDHTKGSLVSDRSTPRLDGRDHVGPYDGEKRVITGMPFRDVCGKCGARRIDEQIGLEETPDAFVQKLVEVFREVRRVLADDGTCWVNLGDSYNGSASTGGLKSLSGGGALRPNGRSQVSDPNLRRNADGLKPKDLVGIPWMVAFALRADGWYLRSDIIWAKPNPMPESVTDRPTKAHEYLFLLSKSPRYFYDADAIAEPSVIGIGAVRRFGAIEQNGDRQDQERHAVDDGKRNRRTVWTISTAPYSEAHFATYPPALVEPCILAGSARGDIVLDPFAGSGTTGMVALRHGRGFIGCELNPTYAEMAQRRIKDDAPLLNRVHVA